MYACIKPLKYNTRNNKTSVSSISALLPILLWTAVIYVKTTLRLYEHTNIKSISVFSFPNISLQSVEQNWQMWCITWLILRSCLNFFYGSDDSLYTDSLVIFYCFFKSFWQSLSFILAWGENANVFHLCYLEYLNIAAFCHVCLLTNSA